ncbi:MAG: hypothetical protein DMG14_35170, partial [Acidobacteria bacterium]
MKKLLVTAGVFVCLVGLTHGFAQSSNATLGGTVTDSSGAFIPGVTVTATNIQTGIVTSVLSKETGA